MNILHITGNHLQPTSGIHEVLKYLPVEQNHIEGVSAALLSLNADVVEYNIDYWFYGKGEKYKKIIIDFCPDVVIIHSFFHVEYAKIAFFLKENSIPFFIEPHGSFGKTAMLKGRMKKVLANNTIFRYCIKNAYGYIFTNQSEYDNSVYRTKNDLIIPNGIVPEIVNSAEMKQHKSFENPIFYFLGRYDINHKGLDYLLDALTILDKSGKCINVNFYGIGTLEQIEYVRGRIRTFKNINANECGTIYGDEKKKALEKNNILLLTSRYEGSPMTILDGLSYGNPCLVTPGTNVADELVENDIGWKTELEADSIAQTILVALEEYRIRGKEYETRCKQYVLDNFAWNKIAQLSVEKLKKLVM